MSTPSMPAASSPEPIQQPGLSEPARIINTFVAPSKTFIDIRRNASWWVPFVLISLVSVAFVYTVGKKIGWDTVANNRVAHASLLQQAAEKMSPEQKQVFMDRQIAGSQRSVYTAPLGNLIFALIFAALLMATFNFGFDAQIKYKTALAVLFYGWLPKIVTALLGILVMTLGVQPEGFDMENPVATHLGVLLGSNTDQRYLYHLLTGFDLISFWWVFLVGLGLATVSKRKISTGAAVTAVAVWYIIGVLIRMATVPFAG